MLVFRKKFEHVLNTRPPTFSKLRFNSIALNLCSEMQLSQGENVSTHV